LPFIREEFTLDYTRSGLVLFVFGLSYGISQLPAGWLADRIGRRILITVGICGVALSGLLVGVSQTYIMMIVFLVLMGMMGGGYHPSASPLISTLVKPENQGRALGLHQIGGSASFFLAPLIASAIATAWGWRSSFIVLSIPTIAIGIVFYMLLGQRADTEKAEHSITKSHKDTRATSGNSRQLVSFFILSTVVGAVAFSIISFIPLFMVDQFGISKGKAAAFLAIVYSCGLWASPLGGYLSDRLGRVPVIFGTCLAAGPVIYLLNLVPYGFATGVVLVALGMITYIRMPVSEAYIIEHTSERHRSTILGMYYFCGMEAGGILTPVMGYLIDQLGFYLSFTIVSAALVVVTFICSIFLRGSQD